MKAPIRCSMPELHQFLRAYLLEDVVPFWLRHAIDPKGGICTCIDDAGSIISYDKLLWSQLRAIYTFSALYNRIEKRQQFLDIGTQIAAFCLKHGRDSAGHWVFRVDREGRMLEGDKSIYTDGFALLGLTELYRAIPDDTYLRAALETYRQVCNRLDRPGSYKTFPYDIPEGLKAHGVSMIFSLAFHELWQITGDPAIKANALRHADQVMDDFRKPEQRAQLEYVRLNGDFDDSPPGRTIVPGHAIESMWFQIHLYRAFGRPERIAQCIECIRWHVERGWDNEYGGLLLGMDLHGKPPYWKYPDAKLWWPHTEALYALLLAHTISGEQWAIDWYWRVYEVAFARYPVNGHGEWTQRMDRRFNVIQDVVGLPVKDPFHLPRSLILSVELLGDPERNHTCR